MPLSPVPRRILCALADAVVPHDARIPFEPTEPTVQWVEKMLPAFSPLLRFAMPLGLCVLEVLPLFFLGTPRRMSSLPRELRRRYVRGFLESRFALRRAFIKGFTGILLMGYYSQPEVLRYLGIDHQAYLDLKRAEREKLLGHPIS